MSDTGYQPYCEKCGAPVVLCTCLDDIDWSPEMRSYLGRVRLEQQVKELRVELARRDEELKITDGLLKEATETIGAVVDAKIGIYGVDQKAFTRIDQFITHYNDAVSARKVSVDVKPVKRDLSDAEIEELGAQEAERYIVSRNCNVSDVSMTESVLMDIKTGKSVEIEELETVVEHLQIRLSEWRGVARQLADELKEEISSNCTVIWEDVGETSPAWIAYNNLVDTEDYETNPDYYNPDYQSPWISITSGRLPEKFQECIVLDKRRHVHNWIHDDALLPLFAQYTHWMPLPEPPEEK